MWHLYTNPAWTYAQLSANSTAWSSMAVDSYIITHTAYFMPGKGLYYRWDIID